MDKSQFHSASFPMKKVSSPAEAQKNHVPAVARAVRILNLISESSEPLTMTDLTHELQLPKSSVHGLCKALIQARLIARLEGGRMTMGPHVMQWAGAFLKTSDVSQAFNAALKEMNASPDEGVKRHILKSTSALAVLDGSDVIYVACHEGNQPLGITFRIGIRFPAPYTSAGKAILSTYSDEDIKMQLSDAWPAMVTPASTQNLAALMKDIRQIRQQGYAIDHGEIREGLRFFGAPVFAAGSKHAVAGVAIGLLSQEIKQKVQVEIGNAILGLAQNISERLGSTVQMRS